MSLEKNKLCKKCGNVTRHYWVKKNDRPSGGGHRCAPCFIAAQKITTHKRWAATLACHANVRNKPGSDRMTAEIVRNKYESQGKVCAITGLELDPADKWYKPSLDRIDPSLGYTVDNIRIVAWIVNHARSDLTDDEFLTMCRFVTANNPCDKIIGDQTGDN